MFVLLCVEHKLVARIYFVMNKYEHLFRVGIWANFCRFQMGLMLRKVPTHFIINIYYRPHPKDVGRLCFHRRLSVHICGGGGEYPIPGRVGTSSQVWVGGTLSQVWTGEYPIPGLDRGYPIPCLDGGTPSHVWMGVPHPRSGWGGTPCPRLDGVPPIRRQIRKASTCYAVGSVPLAFTKEDFLVIRVIFLLSFTT